ncbi:uncharacterized protein LOC127750772 [Frankliniella occidentalis]|uniref:Uncharacterized protein LOC127750772 n=1 Tax=Frankliniella occidentalis TaxID=133901 RepID=A0A9C6X4V7_FRAOC|nr:uncharacterized protein LOC127750772 [Frankliniella occidentalis]
MRFEMLLNILTQSLQLQMITAFKINVNVASYFERSSRQHLMMMCVLPVDKRNKSDIIKTTQNRPFQVLNYKMQHFQKRICSFSFIDIGGLRHLSDNPKEKEMSEAQHDADIKEEHAYRCHKPDYNMDVDEADVKQIIKIESDAAASPQQVHRAKQCDQHLSKKMNTRKVMAIAKAYAALDRENYVRHPLSLSHFNGPTVLLSCPQCLIPTVCKRSALLELLLHISKCHRKVSAEVEASVISKYYYFIQYMEKVTQRCSSQEYVLKLRGHRSMQ